MKKLISLAIIVAFAVLLTLAATENTGRIAVFLPSFRIDFSINFAIVTLFITLFVVFFIVKVLRTSGQVPQKIRYYLERKRQLSALRANREMLSALVVGDSQLADKALDKALKSTESADVVSVMHALTAIQNKRYDLAAHSINKLKGTTSDLNESVQVLEAKIAIAQNNPILALELIQKLSGKAKKFAVIKQIKLHAFLGTERWEEALRLVKDSQLIDLMGSIEHLAVLKQIYLGLIDDQKSVENLNRLLTQIAKEHKSHASLINDLAAHLLMRGWVDQARKLVEGSLKSEMNEEVLLTYQKIAHLEPKVCLPFIENLIEKDSANPLLLSIAAEIYEHEQLWGKAIGSYELLYKSNPSPSLATQLAKLYEKANKPDMASQWKNKLQHQLGLSKKIA